MNNPETLRGQVSDAYAKAIQGKGSCCGPSCCSDRQGYAAQVGYAEAETQALPAHAVESTFGCGNPLSFAGVKEGQTVLDLGSGAGLDLLLAAQKVGPTGRVIGVDMTDAMLQAARRNLDRAGVSNVELRKGIIEALPVESGSVDWVISNCVINLSPEKHRVFAEIARVLKPGGQMRVSDLVAQDLPPWAQKMAGLVTACIGGAVTEEKYLQGLREAGLHEVQVVARQHYDSDQVLGLLSGLSPAEAASAASLTPQQVAQSLAGRVWSATFHASKA
ncbi:MAG: arsenite methyltransferase [Planctomycetes bacterium]|nr:arsenite methyltransferase [Planctomycetota bacterium]